MDNHDDENLSVKWGDPKLMGSPTEIEMIESDPTDPDVCSPHRESWFTWAIRTAFNYPAPPPEFQYDGENVRESGLNPNTEIL